MVKHKKMLSVSIILLSLVTVLNVPFPNRYPTLEKAASVLNIPIQTESGVHIFGLISLALILIGFLLLSISLTKYQGRIIVAAIIGMNFIPIILIGLFQSTFAQGIYAVSYEHDESQCNFEMVRKETLSGNCALHFKNHQNEDVGFQLTFQESRAFEDDPPMVELMNDEAPYNISLNANQHKTIYIDTLIDVSDMPNHIESGQAQGVQIMILSDGHEREI